jgi:hypothetical protein
MKCVALVTGAADFSGPTIYPAISYLSICTETLSVEQLVEIITKILREGCVGEAGGGQPRIAALFDLAQRAPKTQQLVDGVTPALREAWDRNALRMYKAAVLNTYFVLSEKGVYGNGLFDQETLNGWAQESEQMPRVSKQVDWDVKLGGAAATSGADAAAPADAGTPE